MGRRWKIPKEDESAIPNARSKKWTHATQKEPAFDLVMRVLGWAAAILILVFCAQAVVQDSNQTVANSTTSTNTIASSNPTDSSQNSSSVFPPSDSNNSSSQTSASWRNPGDAIKDGPIQIVVTDVEYRRAVGPVDDDINRHMAAEGAILVAVQYTFTNISNQPVSADNQPGIHLLDSDNVTYNSDQDATDDYQLEVNTNQKVVSDLNPGVTTTGAAVFEVSSADFNPSNWYIVFDGDSADEVILPPEGQ